MYRSDSEFKSPVIAEEYKGMKVEEIIFSSGRYKLRIAEGGTWISDEEAFGEEGRYSVIDYFDYQEGETYEITETTDSGNVYKDSAGGFGS